MGSMRHPALRTRYRGVLTLWSEPRFFGFIDTTEVLPQVGEKRIFVHRVNFMAGMKPFLGCEVEFEVGAPYKVGTKPQAVRVKILNQFQNVLPGADALAASKQGGAS